ncbi:hypothetical protein SAMN05216474_0540 [Lishizhenia tianjinensis]|uniref:Lipoprotein n=1 Tax=Lishizhenia tianjinensis TaxID=477690 RepID=A0A1I6XZR4_9FLAO|nr:hypothetical protein [Lishizhenia tianjinensis]SFT43354.1 hypothetical protein SAMN05216474_0540 [Lishizhenia tianjinensis]
MKILIYILIVLTFFGCVNTQENDNIATSDGIELTPGPDKEQREEYAKSMEKDSEQVASTICMGKAEDFLKLKGTGLQADFFSKLDSIRKVQYPNNDQETSIMVDLTLEYLKEFLADINLDSLTANNQFEKEYHFNIAPKGYTDPEICKDKIAMNFEAKNCSFRLSVYNTFLAQPDWCVESMVIYGFKIENDKIVHFWRQEAG